MAADSTRSLRPMSCADSDRGKSDANRGSITETVPAGLPSAAASIITIGVVVAQQGQEVEPAGPSVDQRDGGGPLLLLQPGNRMDADALVAHQHVADAEDQQAAGVRASRLTGACQ